MSKIAVSPNGSGTGTYTLASPNNNASHTLTLPVATGELLTTTGDGSGLTGVDSFKPVAVSGATPSLDVGAYNFFSQGALTANTTVSFASVPTNANWRYSFKPSRLSGEWDATTAAFLKLFSVASQDTSATGVFFKPDGTKMYIAGNVGNAVYEYNLSTAWDVSTASYLQNFSVASQDTSPEDVFFKPDGTKMYVIGASVDAVYEYNLSTTWDVSTATYLQSFSVASQDTAPSGIFFKPDGTKMYIAGNAGDDVNEYDLSTAWNVTTASFLQAKSVATQDTAPRDVFFKPDGLKMYMVGTNSTAVNEYDLGTAWDVSTAAFLQNFSLTLQDSAPYGMFFKPDGTKMYIAGGGVDSILEYDLGTASTVTLPAAVENTPVQALSIDKRHTYEFYTMDGGTTVTLIGEEVIA
jgi:DNA-binding beta-propeller fold protein YncE